MTTTIKRWCSCGDSMAISVDNAHADEARYIVDAFNDDHPPRHPEHYPTDAAGAAAGRRRAERRAERERRRADGRLP